MTKKQTETKNAKKIQIKKLPKKLQKFRKKSRISKKPKHCLQIMEL